MRRREFTLLGGAAVAWPLAVRAQQAVIPVVGFLDGRAGTPASLSAVALRAGLANAGLTVGKNYTLEYRWANSNQPPRLRALADELVKLDVAVIVAAASLGPTRAAMAATSSIPIVFVYGGDPVKDGFITSMNRPVGNVTGVTALTTELAGKRLDLLHKLLPDATTIGFLSGTPGYVLYAEQTATMLEAGRSLGLKIMIVECRDDRDYDTAFASLVRSQAGALILGAFPLPNLGKIIPLAARHRIPTMYPGRGFVPAGGLISYSAADGELYRQAGAQYVARILKGAKPADLPAQQAAKFALMINLKTARALGIEVPPTLLALADEVIE